MKNGTDGPNVIHSKNSSNKESDQSFLVIDLLQGQMDNVCIRKNGGDYIQMEKEWSGCGTERVREAMKERYEEIKGKVWNATEIIQ